MSDHKTTIAGAPPRLRLEQVKAGDVLAWTDGLGNEVRERVFLSKITGNLAVQGIFSEYSVWGLLQIDNGCHIVEGPSAVIAAHDRKTLDMLRTRVSDYRSKFVKGGAQ